MKTVSILIINHTLISAIGNTHHLFKLVNNFSVQSGSPPFFKVQLIGEQKSVKLRNGPYTIQTDTTIAEPKATDLIIIPPMSGKMIQSINANKESIKWLHQQYKKGTEIASLCVGAFLLAETGLLDHKSCSTHWVTANNFRKRYPKVNLVDEKIITDQEGLYTSGGANSYWNLLIYLIEKYAGKEPAVYASKYFAIDKDRNDQLLFSIFQGTKNHGDKEVLKIQEYIEKHYAEHFTISQLAAMVHLSTRTIQRRFKAATHFPIHTYVQKSRIEVAKRLLETERKTINEIMFEAGYEDPKAFRMVFKKETGVSPSLYRNKYS